MSLRHEGISGWFKGVHLHSFLTSAQGGDDLPVGVLRSNFTHGRRLGWPQICCGHFWKEKISCSCQDSNRVSSVFQPVAQSLYQLSYPRSYCTTDVKKKMPSPKIYDTGGNCDTSLWLCGGVLLSCGAGETIYL